MNILSLAADSRNNRAQFGAEQGCRKVCRKCSANAEKVSRTIL
jgi:hypothetical protein